MKTINTVTFDNERWVKLSDLEHLIKRNFIMNEALVWCDDFFTARDKMNAQVHCAPIRLSPITERVRNALEENK